MLMPRFSIRAILLIISAVAVICTIGRFAVKGETWAMAMIFTLSSLFLVMVLYAAMFVLVVVLSGRVARFQRMLGLAPKPESPFATDKLPPQIIAPADPD